MILFSIWEQIFSLIKNQYLVLGFFPPHDFDSLALSFAATYCCSSPQSHHFHIASKLYDSIDMTVEKSPYRSIETASWQCYQCSRAPLSWSWPFSSPPWLMGTGLSSLMTCWFLQPSPSSPPPRTSLCLSLLPIKKQPQQWQGPHWRKWLDKPQSTRGPSVWETGSSVSFDLCRLPMSNKSFSQREAALWPRQSRDPTLSATDI